MRYDANKTSITIFYWGKAWGENHLLRFLSGNSQKWVFSYSLESRTITVIWVRQLQLGNLMQPAVRLWRFSFTKLWIWGGLYSRLLTPGLHCYFKDPGAFRRWGLASRSGPKGRPLKQSPATGFQAEFPVSSFAWIQSCLILLLPRMELLAGICLPPLPCFKLLKSQARIKLPALNHWCQVIRSGWQESN